jgi:hypothetical protein
MGTDWSDILAKDLKTMMKEAYSGALDKSIFGGRRSGKSTSHAADALRYAASIPTFEDEPEARRGSAADSVVDDVLSKLKAGDYQ